MIIGAIVIIVLGTSGFIIHERVNNQKATNIKIAEEQKQEIQFQLSPIPPQESPYSVEIKSPPIYNSNFYRFTYKATIKNNLIKPFITNFGLGTCNFRDENGDKYSGYVSDGDNTFEKAIFPDESREFTSKDIYMYLTEFKKINEGFQKCSYNEKGENVCKTIKDLKITDCIGQISTDGRNASDGYEPQFNVKITFPTL